jgi:hypothetical protein
MKRAFILLAALSLSLMAAAQPTIRKEIRLDGRGQIWKSIADDTHPAACDGFEQPGFDDSAWTTVSVPHNWDKYDGSRQLRHGNRHGTAWYRTEFTVRPEDRVGKRVFLCFEGVGSYGTVWVNGQKAGYHAGGRTTFTLDITPWVKYGEQNTLAVKAEHPPLIADLPWVCGGCSSEWGFSEGSQPMGIFRPVTLVVTGDVRVEPFGIHVWNDTSINEKEAGVHFNTEIKNYSPRQREVDLLVRIADEQGKTVAEQRKTLLLPAGKTTLVEMIDTVRNPVLWSIETPYLYTVVAELYDRQNRVALDQEHAPFGIRTISWHLNRNDGTQTFQLNGKPVLLNGIGEYEHNMGESHAFTPEQITARIDQIQQAGFNAFRDAHQPHNLQYGETFDAIGMLWWSQMSAHIWYDTPTFRENFKTLLRDFVRERRNSPSLILWGLQNESMLPTEFARECTEIIRELDPTTSSQRLVTTCNGGTGTDWNVIQNWSGTYSPNPENYGNEMKGGQILNGEYGAWRSIDWHSEGPFVQNGPLTEDRMTLLMESKIKLIESVRDSVAGQFLWIFSSHDNPGRTQNNEALRLIDRIGPYNYKGLFTPWGEPVDAYYMYRSNYVSADESPMVHIVSHTWPDRWTKKGKKSGIRVFSNCDMVALYNGVNGDNFLGTKTRDGIGTHFVWDDVDIQYCLLMAVGIKDGQPVAVDHIVLNHLPEPPGMDRFTSLEENVTRPTPGLNYLYRVNCGGDTFQDQNGSVWLADRQRTSPDTWGSRSWADEFPGIPPYFGSQRRSRDLVWNAEWPLFQTFRYGRDKLKYEFPVPDGDYTVELYFMEPWYGRDRSQNAEGWRVFDVAINDRVVVEDLDLWKLRGANYGQKVTVDAKVTGGTLTVHFPRVTAGQAVISAIAVATKDRTVQAAAPSPTLFTLKSGGWQHHYWLDTGMEQFTDRTTAFAHLPDSLHGGEWLKTASGVAQRLSEARNRSFSCQFLDSAKVYLVCERNPNPVDFLSDYRKSADTIVNGAGQVFDLYTKTVQKGDELSFSGREAQRIMNLIVVPIPNMGEEPAARPVVTFLAPELPVTGAVERGNFRKEDFVKLNEKGGTIEFVVKPTLAGTYLLRLRYMNYREKTIPMQMELINMLNGVSMLKETISFEPAAEKWRIMSTSTGSQINAGEYKVRLTVLDEPGIEFAKFEFE